MTESQNFVEKELEKNTDNTPKSESQSESPLPTYTPPPAAEIAPSIIPLS